MSHKPTAEEKEERLDVVLALVSRGWRPGKIKRFCAEAWSKSAGTEVKPRSVEPYLKKARAAIIEATNKKPGEHLRDAVAVYDDIIRDPGAGPDERRRAQDSKSKLLALGSYGMPEIPDDPILSSPIAQVILDSTEARSLQFALLRLAADGLQLARGRGNGSARGDLAIPPVSRIDNGEAS